MTVQQTFDNWVTSGLDWDKAPYEACSPNLLLLRAELGKRWPGGENLGCHADREIRTGGTPSEHSWGAALDWRYPAGSADQVLAWIISNSAELGICSIHDYLRSRIWRAGRTTSQNPTDWWRAQAPSTANGMGQSWANYFHFVTTIGKFGDTTPIDKRLTPIKPDPPQPIPEPPEADDMELIKVDYGTALYQRSGHLVTHVSEDRWVAMGAPMSGWRGVHESERKQLTIVGDYPAEHHGWFGDER